MSIVRCLTVDATPWGILGVDSSAKSGSQVTFEPIFSRPKAAVVTLQAIVAEQPT
jgi:hypothetical protein